MGWGVGVGGPGTNSWAKHAWEYSGLLQALEGEHFSALGFRHEPQTLEPESFSLEAGHRT